MEGNPFADLIPNVAASSNPFADLIPGPEQMQVAKAALAEKMKGGANNNQEIYRTAAFRSNQGVPAAGATDIAMNAATAGFGDEAMAAVRAPIDMMRRGEGFDEAYQHNLAAERDRLDQYRKANPGKALAAEVAGGMALPVNPAWGAVKGGALVGGAVGAGSSEGDLPQRAADALVGGVVGAGVGGVLSGAARLVGGKAPAAVPTIEELKAAAKRGYNSEAVTGVEIAPKSLSDAATQIRGALDNEGFNDVVASKAHGILKRLESIPEDAVTVTGRNLHTLQKTLGKASQGTDPQENAAARIALNKLNEFVESMPASAVTRGSADDFARTMREANANYSAAMSSSRVDQKLIHAEIRAGAANSGMNVANTVRQRMADIAINPKQQRGLTADEIAAARQISEGTRGQNILRGVGNVLGGGGGLGTLHGGSLGAAVGAVTGGVAGAGVGGIALPATGMLLRAIGNKMTVNQAQRLSESIRARAPLASATSKFEEKVAQFHEQRNAKTASAASLAARNLATNLRSAGFSVSASDLMRALQAPVASRAEDDQPSVPRPPAQ
jgi:hypothetical protein